MDWRGLFQYTMNAKQAGGEMKRQKGNYRKPPQSNEPCLRNLISLFFAFAIDNFARFFYNVFLFVRDSGMGGPLSLKRKLSRKYWQNDFVLWSFNAWSCGRQGLCLGGGFCVIIFNPPAGSCYSRCRVALLTTFVCRLTGAQLQCVRLPIYRVLCTMKDLHIGR